MADLIQYNQLFTDSFIQLKQVHRRLLRLRGLPHSGHLRGAFGRTRRKDLEGIGETRFVGRRSRHAHKAMGQSQVSKN